MRKLTLLERIDTSGDCWEWTSWKNAAGYGQAYAGAPRKARQAHRLVWELLVGPIPAGLQIDHLCKNRGCVNPDHLEPVTPRVNIARSYAMSARNAIKTHCKRGHEFTPENTRRHISTGNRYCYACRVEKSREPAFRERTRIYDREQYAKRRSAALAGSTV